MSPEDKFSLLFDVGKTICAAYTGFSVHEVEYCKCKSNWIGLQSFLLSNDPYEALIQLELNPVSDVVGYYQLFIGCMLQFPDENSNSRLSNLLCIIDDQDALDAVLKNSKMLRALLAISAKYQPFNSSSLFNLFYNCKRVLAHAFKKFPDMFKLNHLKSKSKSKRLRFTEQEIELFW